MTTHSADSNNSAKAAARSSYQRVGIVGVGLIGGSLALALRRAGFRGGLVGFGRETTLDKARELGVIDEGFPYEELDAGVRDCDLLVLATPIEGIITRLQALSQKSVPLPAGLVITDVGSTKRQILAAAKGLPEHVTFIGGHPLAGSELRGVAAADPFLFQNAYYVLTEAPDVPDEQVKRLGNFLTLTGARVLMLSAEAHDRVAAAISHLPQLLAVSLVSSLDRLGVNREDAIRLAAGGFRDMTRIASSPFGMWRDIVATNQDVIQKTIEEFLSGTRAALGDLNDAQLAELFSRAAETRAEIPKDSKGFLTPLWDVLVEVEDRPGMITEICAPLTAADINVQDIEVLKVREGEGGTIRLSFRTRELSERAIELLNAQGNRARLLE